MATSSWGVDSPEAVKLWSRKLFHEALKATYARKFMGSDSNSLVQIVNDTSKGPGDRVRVTLRMLLTGAGVQGDSTLEGNEEALQTYTDNVFIDQLRHAVRSGGKMSEQRIPFSVREEARLGLQDWWADRIDSWFFNQLAGSTLQSDTRYTGNQAAVAPSSDHFYTAQGGGASAPTITLESSITETTTGSATSSNAFRLSHIDALVTEAKLKSPQIRPVRVGGEDMWVQFLHPRQVKDLRTDVATTRITWEQIQKQAMAGGRIDDNPIFTGALGVYNNVILHESTRVPHGGSSATLTNTYRSIFCGAQAAAMAFGQGFGPSRMSWVEELFDFKNQLGVSAGCIAGLKKTQFNSADFGTLVLTTSWTGA